MSYCLSFCQFIVYLFIFTQILLSILRVLEPWRRRQYFPSKNRELPTKIHNVTPHKTWVLSYTAVRTSNPTSTVSMQDLHYLKTKDYFFILSSSNSSQFPDSCFHRATSYLISFLAGTAFSKISQSYLCLISWSNIIEFPSDIFGAVFFITI